MGALLVTLISLTTFGAQRPASDAYRPSVPPAEGRADLASPGYSISRSYRIAWDRRLHLAAIPLPGFSGIWLEGQTPGGPFSVFVQRRKPRVYPSTAAVLRLWTGSTERAPSLPPRLLARSDDRPGDRGAVDRPGAGGEADPRLLLSRSTAALESGADCARLERGRYECSRTRLEGRRWHREILVWNGIDDLVTVHAYSEVSRVALDEAVAAIRLGDPR